MQSIKNIILQRFVIASFILLYTVVDTHAQETPSLDTNIILSGEYITLGRAMTDIEQQSGYSFAFNMGQLDTGTPVRFSGRELTIRQALAQMFGDGRFKYVVRSRFIAVSPNADNAERANAVARDMDKDLVKTDTLSVSGPTALNVPVAAGFEEEPYEIERIVTIIPAEAVSRDYPDPYSSYLPLNRYSTLQTMLPIWAVKTNFLYGGAFLAPNIAVEAGVRPDRTVELSGGYSWRGRKSAASVNHKQLAHWVIRSEYRWWFCERFDGHYLGGHLLYSKYYISGTAVPLLFDKEYSYDGWAAGAGITYGYNWALAKRWGLEFNIGGGYAYMKYKQGSCVKCDPRPVSRTKHYFGPTRAGVNLLFLIR